MKHTRMTPEQLAQAERSDRNRMIVMGVATVMVAIAFVVSQQQVKKLSDADQQEMPESQRVAETEQVVGHVPAFDMLEVLEPIRDGESSERIVVDQRALDVVFDYGRILTDNQYRSVGIRTLDEATYEELWQAPGEHRVEPYLARGELVRLQRRKRSENRPQEYAGTLAMGGDRHVHFVVLDKPEGLDVGDWARVNGMFLQLYSVEAPGGEERIEAPLLCGPELVRSFAPIVPEGAVATPSLEAVTDDTLQNVTGLPEDALWELMAKASSPDPGTDWESAPALDGQLMGEILADGEPYRGMAVRLELSKNLDGWTERAGENPLRIERVTKGWIGNQTWKGQVPVIYYISPSEQEELHDRYGEARYLEGRGYFFKNYAYTKADGDLGRVPVFVMDTIEAVEIEVDGTPRQIMWAMLGAVLGMIGLLAFLLLRDRRKAAELQAELIRRRRARRGAASSSTGASSTT